MVIIFITGNLKETPDHTITANLDYYGTKRRVEFNGSRLKQDSYI